MWMVTASAAYGATFGLGLGAGLQPGGPEGADAAAAVKETDVEGGKVGEGLEPGGGGFKVLSLRAPIDLELGPRSALRITPGLVFGSGKTLLSGAGVDEACENLAAIGAIAGKDDGGQNNEGKGACVLASDAWRVALGAVAAPEIRFPLGGPAWAYLAPGVGAEVAQTLQDTDYGPWNGCTGGATCGGSPDKKPGVRGAVVVDLAAGVMLRPDSGPGTWFELAYTRSYDPGGDYVDLPGPTVSVTGYRFDVVRLGVGVLFGSG